MSTFPRPWRESINIKQHIDGNCDDDEPVPPKVIEGVRAELRKSQLLPVDDLLAELDDVATVGEFDGWLEMLYNEADDCRVWLGP